jgi:hypothetical protein
LLFLMKPSHRAHITALWSVCWRRRACAAHAAIVTSCRLQVGEGWRWWLRRRLCEDAAAVVKSGCELAGLCVGGQAGSRRCPSATPLTKGHESKNFQAVLQFDAFHRYYGVYVSSFDTEMTLTFPRCHHCVLPSRRLGPRVTHVSPVTHRRSTGSARALGTQVVPVVVVLASTVLASSRALP